jgi:hypothetical protein
LADMGRLVEDAWGGEAGESRIMVILERPPLAGGMKVISDFGS